MGSLASNNSGMNITVFEELDCKGGNSSLTNLGYALEDVFVPIINSTNTMNFTSFTTSRPLNRQEQLDVSTWGQDAGQSQFSTCGAYMMNYGVGTAAGCHNNPDAHAAGCLRLWHY